MKAIRFLFLFILIGCTSPNYRMFKAEEALGTNGERNWIFHRIVDDKHSFGLRFPGYIIGIEKTDADILDAKKSLFFKRLQSNVHPNPSQKDFYLSRLNDPKLTFISHIVDYSKNGNDLFMPINANFVYSAYRSVNQSGNLYDDSYRSLSSLREDIEHHIKDGRYTHIILVSMGWNTDQQESISNFNSLISYLDAENKGNWNPLVLGITWPSTWLGIEPLSYLNKANDADEIGMVWGNAILREVLVPIKKREKIPLILIGHSFGARLITRSVFSHELLSKDMEIKNDDIDLVLGLQGAFPIHRFISEENNLLLCEGKAHIGSEGHPYSEYKKYSRKFVFTWAEEDSANPVARWVTGAKHIGGKPATVSAANCAGIFQMVAASDNGGLFYTEKSESILYIDASAIIRDEQYRKGGRAHSDIYKPEVAKLIWNLIKRYEK